MWVIIRPVSDVWQCLYSVNSLFDTAKQLPNRERNANVFKDPSFWQRERGHRSGFLWLFPRNLVASKCEFRPCKTWFTGLLRCESWHGNEQLHWPWYISSQQAQPRHWSRADSAVAWWADGELTLTWSRVIRCMQQRAASADHISYLHTSPGCRIWFSISSSAQTGCGWYNPHRSGFGCVDLRIILWINQSGKLLGKTKVASILVKLKFFWAAGAEWVKAPGL